MGLKQKEVCFVRNVFVRVAGERGGGAGWSEFCMGLSLGGTSGVVLSRRYFERYTSLLCDGRCVLCRRPARLLLFDAERKHTGTPWKGSQRTAQVMAVPTTVPCIVFFFFCAAIAPRVCLSCLNVQTDPD